MVSRSRVLSSGNKVKETVRPASNNDDTLGGYVITSAYDHNDEK